MSISIYYSARRAAPVSELEQRKITKVLAKYSVDGKIKKYLTTGEGLNWESFCVYDGDSNGDVVFEGATKLPNNTPDATWIGVQHWSAALSEIRNALHGSEWLVHVEDHELVWAGDSYDPSQ